MTDRTSSPDPDGADEKAVDLEAVLAEREARLRQRHPHLGDFLEAMQEPGPVEAAFHVGEQAETLVATSIDERADDRARSLRDRRLPEGGKLEHVAVAPTGVYVIDTRNVPGQVVVDRTRSGPSQLTIGGVDRTAYLDALDRQIEVVQTALDLAGHEIPVQGVICLTKADSPGLHTLEVRGHLLMYRRVLAKRLNAPGPLDPEAIYAIHQELAAALPPA